MPITYTHNIRSAEDLGIDKVCIRYDLIGDDGDGHSFSVARALDVVYAGDVSKMTPKIANALIAEADEGEVAKKQADADAATETQNANVDGENEKEGGRRPYPETVAPVQHWRAAQEDVIAQQIEALKAPRTIVVFDKK